MPLFTSTDPTSGLDAPVGTVAYYVSGGAATQYFKYGAATTHWCTVPIEGGAEPVTADPRSGGLARPIGHRVLYVTGGAGTSLYKYGAGDTNWCTWDRGWGGSSGLSDSNRMSSIITPPALFCGGQASVRNTGDDSTNAVYMGRMPYALSSASVDVFLRVTTAYVAGTGTSWAEVAIATGSIVSGGSPSVTPKAYTDVSGTINSTGIKKIVVTGVTISSGADWWILIANKLGAAGTAAIIRGLSVGDDLVVGQVGTRASFRPSTNIGVSGTLTVDANTAVPPWVAAVLP